MPNYRPVQEVNMNEVLKEVVECVDVEKLSVLLVNKLVLGSLKKVVEDSSNKFDDVIFAELSPLMKKKLRNLSKFY